MRYLLSLRWSSYVAGLKNAKRLIFVYNCTSLDESLLQSFLCENCQRQSCKHSLDLLSMQKWLVGSTPCIWNFESNWPRWSEIADFRCLFSRSASAVTASEKKLQLTLIESPLRAFQWAQDEHLTLSLSPSPKKGGSKTQCQKFEQ